MVCAFLLKKYYPDLREGEPKTIRAIEILVSFAGDFDIILDWVFYADISARENISQALKNAVLTFCILGTLCWLIITSDGRLIAPFMRFSGVASFSTGAMMTVGILLEDLPQVILTLLSQEGGQLSTFALLNLMTALYDVAIKFAEAYDQRDDKHVLALSALD